MTEAERRGALGVWSIQGVGARAFALLEKQVPIGEWLETPWRDLVALLEVPEPVREGLAAGPPLEARVVAVEEAVKGAGQRVCFRGDPQYPAALLDVANAPPLLFYEGPGAVAQTRGRVAIVGTRKTSKEWLSWTARFASACVEQSLVVVSGGAEGVDTAAHTGALHARGITWAFVASGLDQLDPAPKQIVTPLLRAGGSAFSEYPPGTRANSGLFVQRNRLISGSADVVVVVRGKADSGARHTAEAANRQGRALCAVPGAPFERGGELCERLIREGARTCFGVADVLAAHGLVTMPASAPRPSVRGAVSPEAKQIFAALPQGLFDMEQAVAAVHWLSSGALAAALMELELEGWVASRSGRRFEKT